MARDVIDLRGLPRPTPVGVGVAAGVLALALLGWAFGYRALTIAAAAGAAAWVAAWVATVPVPRIDVSRVVQPTRVERGGPAIGLVAVHNPRRRRTRPCLAVDTVGEEEIGVQIRGLRPGQTASVVYQLATHRRGELTVGPLAIVKRDPFGLWQGRRAVGDELTLLVHPRVHPLDPRPSGRARHVEGPVSDTAPRGTLTFHSLREYVPGDDVRRIHWRSTARTGTLMVREHVDTSLPSTVVVLDTRADRYRGDGFEEAVDIAASVVASSQARGFPIHLITSGGESFVVRPGHHGETVRNFLATVQPPRDVSPTSTPGDLHRAAFDVLRIRQHDALVVVTGDVDANDLAAVTLMARRFATPALATVRAQVDSRPVWRQGVHLDGATAEALLARWRTTVASSVGSGGPR